MSAQAADTLSLRIGRATVRADATADVTRTIEAENGRQRIQGLEDMFSVGLIDPARAQALISAIRDTPAALAALGGKALMLDGPALGISFASPTSLSGFKAPIALTVTSDHGDSVMARADLAPDCTVARERAAAARARTDAAERAAQGLSGSEGGRARELLSAAARAWSLNAAVAARCAPGDAAAAEDARAAESKARATSVPSGSMG